MTSSAYLNIVVKRYLIRYASIKEAAIINVRLGG